jgi:putative RNA 2'-phosphotransferase
LPKGRSVSISKRLSYVLRHAPQSIGISLDREGWVSIELLLEALAANGELVRRDELEAIVQDSDKQRFALSPDGRLIRANQGHSVEVDLGYTPLTPPPQLFHGTVARYLPSIREYGLRRGTRHHVHLSATRELAEIVGRRRGKPIVLEVDAARMAQEGHEFFRSENGVWLTSHVPPEFLGESREGPPK